ncbi:MAG: hypothetical protein A2X34_04830 [Elusimicrobia bacterium GWC2_51_8]|nr:MAG: hypothetical protein A2X33_05585 [Elusimicrobia bacterium GWA2_51_34]OGR60413.1 MAG: hypothetical protein A2X34_04830 [Elusimicrobia bacterium GWC2_51_8]OGR86178.1 MAG: hypothetical protein A2021_06060 [Elusimicrobia bacterium GWF2_52_66]HAF94824.1 sugar ABC transporter ATP-binding protein [Elusimicrobiota bacterium]HCE96952.1 sugar ABC transporter ATP-binding protein [Elusimicrobiota bacterium]
MAEVELSNISKIFEGAVRPVLSDISFTVKDTEFVSLLGPSGCGKTTLLRIIAGLEEQTSGNVAIGARDMNRVAPRDRDMAFVFQNYALYPHFSVRDNISLGLRLRKIAKTEIEARVTATAGMLGLDALLERKPRSLSGGQRQRVALARALVRNPKVFLLDEPLSNLDAKLRDKTRGELRMLFKKVKGTVIYVTHDQIEAMTMSDKIVILQDGRIQQIGTPSEIYESPANIFVATFIGTPQMNILTKKEMRAIGCFLTGTEPGREDLACGIRPEDVEASAAPRQNWIEGAVDLCEPAGALTTLTISVSGTTLRCSTTLKWPTDQTSVWFTFQREHIHFFSSAEGARISSGT